MIAPAGLNPVLPFGMVEMTDAEFAHYQPWIEKLTGIHLAPVKKAMLAGRLAKRLRDRAVPTFGDYFQLIAQSGDDAERQIAIDLITTNETYFFREPRHFDALREQLLPLLKGQPVRIWSAASASGEEAYSLAMELASTLGIQGPWEVIGSDISSRVLAQARRGLYPMERAHNIPPDYLKQYCLRGTGEYMGQMLIDRALRQKVRFEAVNLIESLPEIGRFDVIFLRNVIIYFDGDTKRRVVQAVAELLKPGGWLVVGHSESLIGLPGLLESFMPTIYRKRK
ncbi:protein-glutamate O-methyltransferase CheR [Chitinimonas sp. BJYL2]|uniref:CheR family methyltransferase n=1 Tax=Chitinimonas sp. BJYL2 TaxID=2976696 RepID=UPI0022B4A22C|nr:protein-glutamate O-methyltransferase CheR [Chitinimonas sp. BJYL2]